MREEDSVRNGFLSYLKRVYELGALKGDETPEDLYRRVRRIYNKPELRDRLQPGNREAPAMSNSGFGPDLTNDLLHWYTFCDQNQVDIREAPPPLE